MRHTWKHGDLNGWVSQLYITNTIQEMAWGKFEILQNFWCEIPPCLSVNLFSMYINLHATD